MTQGLDGLRERFKEYYDLGARFSKWRAVIPISPTIPTSYGIEVNMHALARYAALSQEAGIVPIVEPEVLMDNSAGGGVGDHSIERCYEVTTAVAERALQPAQAPEGRPRRHAAEAEHGALRQDRRRTVRPPRRSREMTVDCFMHTVPAAVPGIVFLSGGQPDDEATQNMNAIAVEGAKRGAPWQLSFSFGRGLQAAPQKAWSGKKENVKAAQEAFYHRAMVTSAAREGKYSTAMEK